MQANEPDEVISVSSEDPEMELAIKEAKQSIGGFLKAFFEPKPNQTSFLVKVVFDGPDIQEHIWLADLDLNSTPPSGVVANETKIPGVVYMDRVSFTADRITDWMYLEDGFLVGGFTTKVLERTAISPRRKGISRFFPWRKSS